MPNSQKVAGVLLIFFYYEQSGCCLYCKCQMHLGPKHNAHRATFEHLTPRSRGGHTVFENGAASCRRCNNLKHNMTHEEFTATIRTCGSVSAYARLCKRAQQHLEEMKRVRRRAQLAARKKTESDGAKAAAE